MVPILMYVSCVYKPQSVDAGSLSLPLPLPLSLLPSLRLSFSPSLSL